jgi:DNA-binding LacI/PurR family transcriptional regulator
VKNAEHKDVGKIGKDTKKLISYIVPFGRYEAFLKDITLGIEEGFPGDNYLLMNKCFDMKTSKEEDVIASVAEVSDGMILVSTMTPGAIKAISKLVEEKFPVVLIDRYLPEIPCGSVCTDNEEGGIMAVEHLYSRGHKRIRHISVEHDLSSTLGRREGYITGMNRLGLEPDLCFIPEKWSKKDFEKALEKDRNKWPDALFTSNETTAMELYEFLKERGVKIPEDISVMSYGDPYGDELSTISQPKRQMGFKAARLIASIIDGKSDMNTRIMLQPKLIERKSVK